MWCVWLSSVARSCAARDASNKDNMWKPTMPAGINRPPPSETFSHVTRVPNQPNIHNFVLFSFRVASCTNKHTRYLINRFRVLLLLRFSLHANRGRPESRQACVFEMRSFEGHRIGTPIPFVTGRPSPGQFGAGCHVLSCDF